jgi:predicted AlkP superfamily phosphohydrolase/phosphomutase
MTARRCFLVRWLVAMCVLVTSCGESSAPRGRVLLLGIDGATLRLAGPLLDQGRLPHLRGIAEKGVSGPLRSFRPLLSPRIWTSVATGKAPARHGIRGWVTEDERGTVRLYNGLDRKAHALWNIASDAGLEVAVVNWLVTHPPERIRGVMVSDHALPGQAQGRRNLGDMFAKQRFGESLDAGSLERAGPVSFPAAWDTRVAELVGDQEPWSEDLLQDDARFLEWVVGKNLTRDREIVKIALAIDSELHPDLLMVLLQGIDRVSHVLWSAVEPPELYPEELRPSPERRKSWAGALDGYYEQTDALIGELAAGFGPDDLVVVLSDHGFEAVPSHAFSTGGHDSPAAQDGVLFARGPDVPAAAPAGAVTVNDITPTILAWLGMPVAADMDGRPAAFLSVAPQDPIATYDTTPIERPTDARSGAEVEILEELRSLGYVE